MLAWEGRLRNRIDASRRKEVSVSVYVHPPARSCSAANGATVHPPARAFTPSLGAVVQKKSHRVHMQAVVRSLWLSIV